MGVGSGIVIDSDPAGEFRECLLKAEFLTARAPPEPFSLIESLLWKGEYPLIELHLDRLEDSAGYFGFPCDRADNQSRASGLRRKTKCCHPELNDCHPERAQRVEGSASRISSEKVRSHKTQSPRLSRKVRLLLNQQGNLQIEDELLPDYLTAPTGKLIRVRIATQRTDPQDPMLFHKTTLRPLYVEALKSATQAGFGEVLFLNLRGEVTEGAISNIFIEKDDRWFTPPIECGLLAGVQRRHILETQPNIEEKVLYLQDLREAGAIYLSNAVRGLRPAVIDWEV